VIVPSTVSIDRELVRRMGFPAYVELAACHVTGLETFVPGRHINVIAREAEAFYRGRSSVLLVNLPPGVMKSVLLSVLLPSWIWTVEPEYVFMCASYEQSVASDLAGKARDLMLTKWWRDRWGDLVVGGDDGAVSEYWTTHDGFRLSTSVQQGRGIGRHCNMYIVDDPTKTQAIDDGKGAILAKTKRWFERTVLTRGKIGKAMRVLVTMQRLHEDDLSGHIVGQFKDSKRFRHISLPWEFEPERATDVDWRTVAGEELWPEAAELGKREEIERLVAAQGGKTGSVYRAQYQQDPTGGDDKPFPAETILDYTGAPPFRETMSAIVVDPTFTGEERSDLMSVDVFGFKDGHMWLYYSEAVRRGFKDAVDAIKNIRSVWPAHHVLVEGSANGHAILETLDDVIGGLVKVKPQGSKMARARAASYHAKAGRFHIDKRQAWAAEKERYLVRYPGSDHDDPVDTVAYGINWLHQEYGSSVQFNDAMTAIRENRDDGTAPRGPAGSHAAQMAGFFADRERRAAEVKDALGIAPTIVLPFGDMSIEAFE